MEPKKPIGAILPDDPRFSPDNPRFKTPHFKAMIEEIAKNEIMREWVEENRAWAVAASRAKAWAVVKAQRLRCLGLASGDPEHLEFYAIEAGLDPELVREVLETTNGARLGLMMEGQLRSSGELDQVRMSWVMPDACAVIKTSIATGSMSDSVATKLIETVGKQNGRGGEKREAATPIPPFEGRASELVASLTDSAPYRGSLPFTQPGDD